MNLSDELFEQIVASLAAGGVTTLPDITLESDDKRRGKRFSADPGTTVRLIPLTDALSPGPVDVALRDVAPGGARFLFPARVGLDEQFVLVLPSEEGQVAILCGVAYWQPVGPDVFAIGAKFNRVLRQGSAQPSAPTPARAAAAVRRAV
jgi:hypothetical protein